MQTEVALSAECSCLEMQNIISELSHKLEAIFWLVKDDQFFGSKVYLSLYES